MFTTYLSINTLRMSTLYMSLLLCVVRCIHAFHSPLGARTLSMCSGAGIAGKSPSYLQLDSGLRISRIITVTTESFDVMLKLSRAKSRSEIMHTCFIRHKRKCVVSECQQLPVVFGVINNEWSYWPRPDAHVRTNSGTYASTLWVIDSEFFDVVHIEVGSWLLASMPGKCASHLSTIFSRTISRAGGETQSVPLVRLGFAPIQLLHTQCGLMWVMTLVELQQCDEWGNPTKRY